MEGLRIAPVVALTVMRQIRHEHGHLLPGQSISSIVAQLSSLEKKRAMQSVPAEGREMKLQACDNSLPVGPDSSSVETTDL